MRADQGPTIWEQHFSQWRVDCHDEKLALITELAKVIGRTESSVCSSRPPESATVSQAVPPTNAAVGS